MTLKNSSQNRNRLSKSDIQVQHDFRQLKIEIHKLIFLFIFLFTFLFTAGAFIPTEISWRRASYCTTTTTNTMHVTKVEYYLYFFCCCSKDDKDENSGSFKSRKHRESDRKSLISGPIDNGNNNITVNYRKKQNLITKITSQLSRYKSTTKRRTKT